MGHLQVPIVSIKVLILLTLSLIMCLVQGGAGQGVRDGVRDRGPRYGMTWLALAEDNSMGSG